MSDDKTKGEPNYRCPAIVDKGRSYDPSFEYRINGEGPEFGFSLSQIPEKGREWLAGVVMGMLERAFEHGRQNRLDELQRALAGLLFGLGLQVPSQLREKVKRTAAKWNGIPVAIDPTLDPDMLVLRSGYQEVKLNLRTGNMLSGSTEVHSGPTAIVPKGPDED